MMQKKHSLTYNRILLLLAVSLIAVMLGSVTRGRYPIGLKELGYRKHSVPKAHCCKQNNQLYSRHGKLRRK